MISMHSRLFVQTQIIYIKNKIYIVLLRGHHGMLDIEVMLLDHIFGEERLRDKEGSRAYRLRTVAPDGLNSNDFFYSNNRRLRARN